MVTEEEQVTISFLDHLHNTFGDTQQVRRIALSVGPVIWKLSRDTSVTNLLINDSGEIGFDYRGYQFKLRYSDYEDGQLKIAHPVGPTDPVGEELDVIANLTEAMEANIGALLSQWYYNRPNTLHVYVSPEDSGYIGVSPSRPDYEYPPNTELTLTAVPYDHYGFDQWIGPVSYADQSKQIIRVTMPSYPLSIYANFKAVTRTLIIGVGGQGITTPSVGPHSYNEGTDVTVTASPASGWRFSRWEGEIEIANGADSPTTVIAMNRDKSIHAYFEEIPPPPPPALVYIANRYSREIHNAGCIWVTKMKEHNKLPCGRLGEVADLLRDRGYNGCFYCLPRYDTDVLSRERVLTNLEEDL